MLKKISLLIVLCLFIRAAAQQNEEFRNVKQRFDYHKMLLLDAFKKDFDTVKSEAKKSQMRAEFADFIVKMDSVQNSMYLGSLVKVKNSEDLARLAVAGISEDIPKTTTTEKQPEYPGGIPALRREIGDIFYSGNMTTGDQKQFRSNVTFVVEKDGSVTTVEAAGENVPFNKQAMIAVYLLPGKFSPAYANGQPVRYRFTLPITLNFE